jgi:methionine-rich copper-binding protein CopC
MKQFSLIATFFITFIFAMNTYAHTGLKSSVPTNNAMLMESFDAIELHFSGAVNLIKLELVNKADGEMIDLEFSPVATAATDFSQPLPALKIGNYQVNWTAMGSDGHKMQGNFSFMMHVETDGGHSGH